MKATRGINRITLIGLLLMVTFLVTAMVPNLAVTAAKSTIVQPGNQLPPDSIVTSDGQTLQAQEFSLTTKGESGFAGTNSTGSPTRRVELSEKQFPSAPSLFRGSVIGTDGRTRVTGTTTYPNRAIVFLVITFPSGNSYTCSGFFYGPRTVATAGHCVYEPDEGGWASAIKVYPGRNGTSAPYSYTTMHRAFSVTGWTSNGDPNYDYGAIQTNSAKGNTVGWFGYYWQASNTFSGTYYVRGYPGDKTYGTMWTMSGAVKKVNANRLWYSIDSYGGQSGSPFFKNHPTYGWAAAGIHTYGVGLSPYTTYNSATRITQTRYNNMKTWKNYAYP